MRYPGYFVLLFIGVIFQMVGCDQKKNLVRISFHHSKAAGDTVKISKTNMVSLENIELAKVRLDSAGKGIVEFELDEPVFVYTGGDHLAAGLFISPGDEIRIVPSGAGAKLSIGFEGDGASTNQFINEAQQIRDGLEKWKGEYAIRLDQNEFLKAKDSLQRAYDLLLNKLKSDKQVPEQMIDLMTRKTKMSVLFYQYNFAIGRDSSEIPAPVREAVKQMPVDTIALKTRMYDYALIASFFYQHEINNAIYDENSEMDDDSLDAVFPSLVEDKIKAGNFPKQIEDYLRVKSADYQIRMYGLAPNIMKLAATLEKEVASSELKKAIREDVARWEKLGPGKPAPEFSGIAPGGEKISLSDLRGKVVYVDIWATWCGPCVGEFPDAKKVQSEFKGNDKVAFLYVSVDRDTLAWKKMVASDKVPKGIHIRDLPEGPRSVWELYYVWGIPRYLLIDAQGRMVATHAVRPSSGELTAELKKLLGSDKVARR